MVSSIVAANNGAAFLQSVQSSGSWFQDAAAASASRNVDWMDPSASSSSDVVKLAANAFASAHLVSSSQRSSLAVNQGIKTIESALAGRTVNFLT
jgi:hypothetical protein